MSKNLEKNPPYTRKAVNETAPVDASAFACAFLSMPVDESRVQALSTRAVDAELSSATVVAFVFAFAFAFALVVLEAAELLVSGAAIVGSHSKDMVMTQDVIRSDEDRDWSARRRFVVAASFVVVVDSKYSVFMPSSSSMSMSITAPSSNSSRAAMTSLEDCAVLQARER